jgi:hypothetical protein
MASGAKHGGLVFSATSSQKLSSEYSDRHAVSFKALKAHWHRYLLIQTSDGMPGNRRPGGRKDQVSRFRCSRNRLGRQWICFAAHACSQNAAHIGETHLAVRGHGCFCIVTKARSRFSSDSARSDPKPFHAVSKHDLGYHARSVAAGNCRGRRFSKVHDVDEREACEDDHHHLGVVQARW